jgi:organic hydroperoxide reductase OsmC/OhrA
MAAGREHRYRIRVRWTGNRGTGTSAYRAYGRDHMVEADGKPPIPGSADPAFRGDPARWNPEDLLVAALSACHQLWYMHLCADAGIVVTAYEDAAEGTMVEEADGGGRFTAVVLRPRVTVAPGSDAEAALRIHADAHRLCFVARSVNFDVRCEAAAAVG